MKETSFVLKGDFCWSSGPNTIETREDGYLVCVSGVSAGVFSALPEQYAALPLLDWSGKLVTPGLTDLHVHAPQYAFRGLGMDLELLDWLNTNTFPEEGRYADLGYAQQAYRIFVRDMLRGPNTRACVFATVHVPATEALMELLEESGLETMVGKVNMDRNCPDPVREESAEHSARATVEWLERIAGKCARTRPILTPRFIPSCTDALMERVAELQKKYALPVQSHLSENRGEVEWVGTLCPKSSSYGDAYASFDLFGGGVKTVMAHCVLSDANERRLMKERGVYVAHCPQSNENLSSGVAPVRAFLEEGLRVGLGSDVAGGSALSIFRAMTDAVQASKLRWRLLDQRLPPLTVAEVFWLGTAGGGSFFGKVGSFAPGYELDAIALDDGRLKAGPRGYSLRERLERVIFLSEDRDVAHKVVRGRQLF